VGQVVKQPVPDNKLPAEQTLQLVKLVQVQQVLLQLLQSKLAPN